MLRNKTLGLALVAALSASPFGLVEAANAAPEAHELHLRYEANWGGLHVADFTLSLINGGKTFENQLRLETRGMTRYFSNLSLTANSRGVIVEGEDGKTYLSNHYRSEYTNHKHFRWVDIVFPDAPEPAKAETGTAPIQGMEDEWNPEDKGPEVLDKVENEFLVEVSDPITLIPQMIDIVRAHLGGGPASGVAKGFDGRRRFDMLIDYLGPATRTISGVEYETYRVRVHPKPVAGFKDRHKEIWEKSSFDFYLSRDGSFKPLQIVPLKHGPVLTMTAECPSACELKREED